MEFSRHLHEALRTEPSAAKALVHIYTRDGHWHLPAGFLAAYLINMTHGEAAGKHWVDVFHEEYQHVEYFDSYGIEVYRPMEPGLPGHMMQYEIATGTILEVLWTLCFLIPGHAQPGYALECHYWCIAGIRLCLQWGPDQTPSRMTYTCIYTVTVTANCH